MMRRQQSFTYPFASPPTGRNHGVQHAGTAQLPPINPNEDWTKISDLAERRRIQNRIAQRNYRKKLKRRLEDLERRAGSSSPPPDQQSSHAGARNQEVEDGARKRKLSRQGVHPLELPSRPSIADSSAFPQEDPPNMFARQHTRQLSTSPPPAFTYSFTVSESSTPQAHFAQHTPFTTLPYPEYPNQTFFLPPLPSGRAGLGALETPSAKPEPHFQEDDLAGPLQMVYPNSRTLTEVGPNQANPNHHTLLNVKWLPQPTH